MRSDVSSSITSSSHTRRRRRGTHPGTARSMPRICDTIRGSPPISSQTISPKRTESEASTSATGDQVDLPLCCQQQWKNLHEPRVRITRKGTGCTKICPSRPHPQLPPPERPVRSASVLLCPRGGPRPNEISRSTHHPQAHRSTTASIHISRSDVGRLFVPHRSSYYLHVGFGFRAGVGRGEHIQALPEDPLRSYSARRSRANWR